MSVVSEWRKKLKARKKLRRAAKLDYQAAQAAYEKAHRKHLKKTARLRDAAERARGKLKSRRKLVRDAEKIIARHSKLAAPKPERTHISVNKSSRGGVKPRLIVLHITVSHNRPGLGDIDGILDFFDRTATQASSHVVNDREGNDARCVPDEMKAWTCAAYNPQSLNIEQIEYEVKSRPRWLSESSAQLENTALWVAYWSRKYDIPLKHSTVKGVCQHRELGAAGGGHSDCSPDFPLDVVLDKARAYAARM